MFATMIPRNGATRHESTTTVNVPDTTRITFATFSALALMMLRYKWL